MAYFTQHSAPKEHGHVDETRVASRSAICVDVNAYDFARKNNLYSRFECLKKVVSSVLAISSDCAAIWDNLPKTPEPNMSWHNGISLFRIFPRLLQVGVVSKKYGTPYVLANLMITSLFTGSIGRYIVTPLTLLDGYLKV